VLLSHDCCDCWYRKAVRTSMGHVFHLPVIRVPDLADALRTLHRECGMESFAAVIDERTVHLRDLHAAPARWYMPQ
jgi:tRNA G18 (ribose-2'-O)-methylase SpoU